MVSLKRLKAKQEDLEDEWQVIRKTLARLKKALAKEDDVLTQIKLEEEINEREIKLKKIEEELDRIEEELENPQEKGQKKSNKISSEGLLKTLLKLGFWKQHRFFENIVLTEKEPNGAFLIQGRSKQHGQKWLANRLASIVPQSLGNYYIPIDLDRRSLATNMSGIWEEFTWSLNLEQDCDPEDIIQNIIDLLKSQNVVICFDNVDESVEDNLLDLVHAFWDEIAKEILEDNQRHSPYKLLVFFLDYQGIVNAWNISWSKGYEPNMKSSKPFNLPEIIPFSSEVIRNWIEQQSDHLPEIFSLQKEETIKKLKEYKGIPELTIRKICALCNSDWTEIQGNLLKRKK